MRRDSSSIDKQLLAETIISEYSIPVKAIRFIPGGEDSFSYLVETVSKDVYFVRVQSSNKALDLNLKYYSMSVIREKYGFWRAVSPYMTINRKFTILFQNHVVALFPYIKGQPLDENRVTNSDVIDAATLLAFLHRIPHDLMPLQREDFGNPFRIPILNALDAASMPSSGQTPIQKDLCNLMVAERTDIIVTLQRMEDLQTRAQAVEINWRLTHGDFIHPNLLRDEHSNLHLIDWGDLAIGPVERDLTLWTGDTFEVFLDHYARLMPAITLHRELFEFYIYRWCMQEIADYATKILFQHLDPVEDEHAWEQLQDYLPIQHWRIEKGLEEIQAIIDQVLGRDKTGYSLTRLT